MNLGLLAEVIVRRKRYIYTFNSGVSYQIPSKCVRITYDPEFIALILSNTLVEMDLMILHLICHYFSINIGKNE